MNKAELRAERINQVSGIVVVRMSDWPCNGVNVIYFDCKKMYSVWPGHAL